MSRIKAQLKCLKWNVVSVVVNINIYKNLPKKHSKENIVFGFFTRRWLWSLSIYSCARSCGVHTHPDLSCLAPPINLLIITSSRDVGHVTLCDASDCLCWECVLSQFHITELRSNHLKMIQIMRFFQPSTIVLLIRTT